MALLDKQIVKIIVDRLVKRLFQIQTKAELEAFFTNLTKIKVKTLINNAIEDEAVKREGHGAEEISTAVEIRTVKGYVDTL